MKSYFDGYASAWLTKEVIALCRRPRNDEDPAEPKSAWKKRPIIARLGDTNVIDLMNLPAKPKQTKILEK